MNLIKNYFKNHIYFYGIFAFVLLYDFLAVGIEPWDSANVYYSFYLIDFSFGFCSKILPGAIYNFLFDDNECLPERPWLSKISAYPVYIA